MRIARVFPRHTNATPDDDLAFTGMPPEQELDVDEVHISFTFTYDMGKFPVLLEAWSKVADVKIGGPALDDPGADFTPGMYIKHGYVITSRGCPNSCWFCDVPRREGRVIRELPITNGWNVLDSNLLACSDEHVASVFDMLSNQKHQIEFTGGFEAARLRDFHIGLMWDLRPKQVFFAYDTPDDLDPLIEAGRKLRYANFTRSHLRCYVLIGWPKDTFEYAQLRLLQAWKAGFMPMAMLWKNKNGDEDPKWRRFQRTWARPAATKKRIRELFG